MLNIEEQNYWDCFEGKAILWHRKEEFNLCDYIVGVLVIVYSLNL